MYKLCPYRSNVQQQCVEMLHHMNSSLDKARVLPLRLPPEILTQIKTDLGIEGNTMADFQKQYEESIETGNMKWSDLQNKLQGRLSVAYAQLHLLQPTQFEYALLKEKGHQEILDIQKEITVLQEQYKTDVVKTATKWKPYHHLMKNAQDYYTTKTNELEVFKEETTNKIAVLCTETEKKQALAYRINVKYNQLSANISAYPNETVQEFMESVLRGFGLEYPSQSFRLFIAGGPHLHPKTPMSDYILDKIKYLKLIYLNL